MIRCLNPRPVLVLPLLAAMTGCAAGHVADAFRRAHPGCEDEVEVVRRPGRDVFDVRGCGITDTIHEYCPDRMCAYQAASEALERAAFELDCPRDQLEAVVLGDDLGISGCGHRVVYVPTFESWMADSAGSSSGGEFEEDEEPNYDAAQATDSEVEDDASSSSQSEVVASDASPSDGTADAE